MRQLQTFQFGLIVMGIMEGLGGWRTISACREAYTELVYAENVPNSSTFSRFLNVLVDVGVLEKRVGSIPQQNSLVSEYRWIGYPLSIR